VKKTNKTKKEKKKEKKTRLPQPVSQPNLWTQQQSNGPSLPRFPFFILLRRAAAVRQG
jgi:hypothetical protein